MALLFTRSITMYLIWLLFITVDTITQATFIATLFYFYLFVGTHIHGDA